MIIITRNEICIRFTLINLGSILNFYSVDLLYHIHVENSSLVDTSLFILGFDNIGKTFLPSSEIRTYYLVHLGIGYAKFSTIQSSPQ